MDKVWILFVDYGYDGQAMLAVFDHYPTDDEQFISANNKHDMTDLKVEEWEVQP